MGTRNRTEKWIGLTGGTAVRTINGTPIANFTQDNTNFPAYFGNIIDVTGNSGGSNPLTLEKTSAAVTPLNGTHTIIPTHDVRTYSSWIAGIQRTVPSHLSFTIESDAASALKVLARSNPNRAEVNLPVSIFELKDLPRMLQFAGKTMLKRSANSYLNWSFGWAPLISDLRKLVDFNSRVDRRVKEFHSLYSKGGLRRRLKLDNQNKEDHSIINIESNLGDLITCRQNRFSNMTRWGTVRWLPTSLPLVDENALRKQARNLVYDLQLSASNIWQAMPWSWLIDWYANIGDFIEATKNTVPVSHGTVNLMTHYETKISWTASNASTFGYTGGTGSAIRKTSKRTLVTGTSLATTPFLGLRQLSILGALFIVKHKPHGWTG